MLESWLFLLACSLSGAFLSSLLGIGGAVFIIPIILLFQKYVGLNLGMHAISSLTTMFVFFAGAVGFWAHGRHYKIEKKLVLITGSCASVGALAGGIVQFYLPHMVMLVTFIALLFIIAGMMLWPVKGGHDEIPDYPLTTAIIGCVTAGFLAGMVGIGGGTILVPFMIAVLKIPTRPAITTGLALVLLAGFFGLLGRLSNFSAVPWTLGIPLVAGILPGSLLGTYANRVTPTPILRKSFAVLMLVLATQQLLKII